MIKEIIVVEGKDDTTAIRRAVEAETIETGGSAINEAVYRRIERAQATRGVIIFTDPDHAGERLRKLISARVPGCKHAFITQEEGRRKDDIGVENASPETIRSALMRVKSEFREQPGEIGLDDLMEAGLLVHPDAARRRLAVGNALGIGYANGKQFLNRCRMFQITRSEFAEAVAAMLAELDPAGMEDESHE
ncbi:ribonuclease M5 [Gorillibacterium sp. sgz500922]|uniref:ribonuclease M5 n=1 Tax=Gorillibacterium sp. sgz500922 TaxID=3446694 RepID=UPI003F661550